MYDGLWSTPLTTAQNVEILSRCSLRTDCYIDGLDRWKFNGLWGQNTRDIPRLACSSEIIECLCSVCPDYIKAHSAAILKAITSIWARDISMVPFTFKAISYVFIRSQLNQFLPIGVDEIDIQLLLTMHDHSVTPDEHASCNTRFFSFSNKERRIQDIALIKANDRLLNDKAISTSLWKRLYSAKPYWKQYHSFNYRFTAEDFLSMQYGTCLDTAIIASSLFHQNNIPNYVLNIRGVQGGHSILIVHNDNICVSNFSFRNHTYLQDCLAKFDIDSIIVSGQEYWCEDLVGDCALVNALSDLARHGNYRFYCRRIKASLTISTIMKYLDSFKS